MVPNPTQRIKRERGPSLHQLAQGCTLRRGRQSSLRVTGTNAQAMIQCAIEGRGIAQESSLGPIQVMHALQNLDAFGGIQRLKKYPRAFEAQIHQKKVDIVISTATGFQWMRRALLFFQALAHLLEVGTRTAALTITHPIDGLKMMKE